MTVPLRSECSAPATMQMTQQVAKANGAVLDRRATQAGATLLQVRIDVANAQAGQALLVRAWSQRHQEPQRVRRSFGPRLRLQPTQVSKPRVVLVHKVPVKGFERGSRRVRNRPSSVHQAQQHVNGTSVSMAPFLKWRRLSVPSTEERYCRRKNCLTCTERTACIASAFLGGSNRGSGVREPDTTAGPDRNTPRLSGEPAVARSTNH